MIPQHVEPPCRGPRVDALIQHDQIDSEILEVLGQVHEMPDAAGKPVQPPDRHRIEAVPVGVPEQPAQGRPLRLRVYRAPNRFCMLVKIR